MHGAFGLLNPDVDPPCGPHGAMDSHGRNAEVWVPGVLAVAWQRQSHIIINGEMDRQIDRWA